MGRVLAAIPGGSSAAPCVLRSLELGAAWTADSWAQLVDLMEHTSTSESTHASSHSLACFCPPHRQSIHSIVPSCPFPRAVTSLSLAYSSLPGAPSAVTKLLLALHPRAVCRAVGFEGVSQPSCPCCPVLLALCSCSLRMVLRVGLCVLSALLG